MVVTIDKLLDHVSDGLSDDNPNVILDDISTGIPNFITTSINLWDISSMLVVIFNLILIRVLILFKNQDLRYGNKIDSTSWTQDNMYCNVKLIGCKLSYL